MRVFKNNVLSHEKSVGRLFEKIKRNLNVLNAQLNDRSMKIIDGIIDFENSQFLIAIISEYEKLL